MQVRTGLAIGSWIFVAVVALGQGKRFGQVPQLSPEQQIEQLQKGYQAALDDLTMTKGGEIDGKDENGKPIKIKLPPSFGIRREPSFIVLHDRTMRDTGVDVFSIGRTNLAFYTVSQRGKPLAVGKMTLHKDLGTNQFNVKPQTRQKVEEFASKALPTLWDKDLYQGKIDGEKAEARPLRLSKKECLSCHPGSKLNDPMAVMVYVIKQAKT